MTLHRMWDIVASATNVQVDSLLQLGHETYEALHLLRDEYFSQKIS